MILSKHHGLGNDFLVLLDERQGAVVPVGPDLARMLCDRHTGIGADGLLHGSVPSGSEADVTMVLYNADGSRAEMSGNGIRCFAHAVARARGLGVGTLAVDTDAGRRDVVLGAGAGAPDKGEIEAEVDMGRPQPGPGLPGPVGERLAGRRAGTVDMGNPHLVVLVDDVDDVDAAVEGPWLESQFEMGINVEFIAVDRAADPPTMSLRVWERGAGLTQACGTGACAAVVQAGGWGLVGERVPVSMPGGSATVVRRQDGGLTLIGPSVHIAEIEVTA